jgi:hypothetical protein
MKLKKIILIPLFMFCLAGLTAVNACLFPGLAGSSVDPVVELVRDDEEESGSAEKEDYKDLLENQDFLTTFDTFYYPGSTVKEADAVTPEQEMIYVIMETGEAFDAVEDYYMNKKVQSIWNRDFIYHKSMAEVEQEFIEEEEAMDIMISKFTFSSKDRDKVVDVLVKELAADRTQVMMTYWDLQ